MAPLWEGEGLIEKDNDVLTCTLARFVLTGVKSGDLVGLTSDGEERLYRILQAPNDDQLQYDGDVKAGVYKVRVLREVNEPCEVCKKLGHLKEATHLHCNTCRAEVAINDERRVNCIKCILEMRKRLARGGSIVTSMSLFGGKKTIVIHARTVAEGDQIQEFQDRMIKQNPDMTLGFVLDESRKAAVAMSLDNDGDGRSPRDMIVKPGEVQAADQVAIMMKHFRGMSAPYYNAIHSAVGMHDSLLDDACRDRVNDDVTEDDLLRLSEDLALNRQPTEGTVSVWGDEITLIFAAPSTDDIDDGNAFAENFIRSSRETILDVRAKFIVALARLAVYFRGDNTVRFDSDSTFEERINHLLALPINLFYVYQDACLVWQRRLARASEVEVLGNF